MEKFEKNEVEGRSVYEIPIFTSKTVIADIIVASSGTIRHSCSYFRPYLIMEEKGDYFHCFVSIIIKNAFSKSSYLIRDSSYPDIMITSDMDGCIEKYESRHDGIITPFTPKKIDIRDERITQTKNTILGYKIAAQSVTKGGDIPNMGESYWTGVITCSNCGRQYNAEIWGSVCYYCGFDEYQSDEYCQYCHQPIDNCICGKEEEVCPYCGKLLSLCICDPVDPEHPDVCDYCGRPLTVCDTHCRDTCSICGRIKLYCPGHN